MLDIALVTPVIFIFIGAAFLWYSISSYMKNKRIAERGVLTNGIVVNVELVDAGKHSSVPRLTIRFQEKLGRDIEFSYIDRGFDIIEIGDSVNVTYNPQYPKEAFVGSPEEHLFGCFNIMVIVLGSIFILGGILMLAGNILIRAFF